ncbi:MAG TPA: serine/threonine-protein kinase [Urbifossiella sp.]|jgi:serine/threonine protein kinase
MPVNLDAAEIGQLILKLGLASDAQIQDSLIELDDRKASAESMVRLMERKGFLTPWQGNKLLKGDTDGYVLGGYRLLYKVASGSFGRVYRGDDPRTGQIVAVKVLRNKWTMDKQKVELFTREGKLGIATRHPNIVSVLAVNQDAKTGQHFLVMEFIEGGNLRDLINIRKKVDIDESLRIMEDCAAGLQGAALKNLTHRDIKPTNILISAQGQVKLVDFGLAEITAGGSVHLQRQSDRDDDVAVDRTVDYAGLEKATGVKPGDIRSDIYFLGTVLYEMVTGLPLMPVTKDRQARMSAGRYREVEDTLAKAGPQLGLPSNLQKLLAKMVSYDPKTRFQNPTELLEGIRACRADLGGKSTMGDRPKAATGPKTLFVVETSEKLKDAFREKFKANGFRVLLTIDPAMAIKRFQEQPYHSLIIDARTIGDDAVQAYNRVLREADSNGLVVGAILIVGEDQKALARQAREHGHGAVLTYPVTMKQLIEKVYELSPAEEPDEAEAG